MGLFKMLADAARASNERRHARIDAQIERQRRIEDPTYYGDDSSSCARCCANCTYVYRDFVYQPGINGMRYVCREHSGGPIVFNEDDVDNGILQSHCCSRFNRKI